MQSTKLAIIWKNPKPPEKGTTHVKRIETGKFTNVYLVTKPAFTNRLAVVSKRTTSALRRSVNA
jgi:hypothetical protein